MVKIVHFVAGLIAVCSADQIQNPIRLRISSDILQNVFHTGDQKMLEFFSNLKFERTEEESEFNHVSQINARIAPKFGKLDDYDFTLALNDEELGILGIQGLDLIVLGSVKTIDNQVINFESDLKKFVLEVRRMNEEDTAILEYN